MRMHKRDIEATQSKSVKNKKQIEIIVTDTQRKEFSEKHKSEGKKKKKHKVKTLLSEANESELASYPEACSDMKSVKKKKSKSKRARTIEEDKGSKNEKKLTKEENPPEGEVQEDVYGGLKKKKKKKKKCKPDDDSDPQNITEESNRKTCEDEAGRVQNEAKHVKSVSKDGVRHVNVEEGLAKGIKTSDGTADEMTEEPCVADAKSMKKKKKRSHMENIETHETEKSPKKQKKDKHSGELETGYDQFSQADVRKQKHNQMVDNHNNETDKKFTKKKKKEKLHSKRHLLEPEESHNEHSSLENERKNLEEIENVTECSTKSKKKKRKRSITAEGEEIEKNDKEINKCDKTSNICKSQHSPSKRTKEDKQEAALDVPKESIKNKKKIKKGKKDAPPGTQAFKVKTEQCDSDDLQIISERKGSLFEVTIDKARRKALQEEIDRESGKTDTPEPRASFETKPLCTGTQWDTATFESVDQKNKFLRLMGGLKSSNQTQSTGHVYGKPNMAFNKQEEKKHNSILQREFDKALNLRQNRGIGLGFQASPDHAKTKTFFIDKHATNSKKFDLD
ncbi:lysine-rich nucleolar protein 1-like isoform X2 [Mobula hypostoma]|uniref:lysine-rich nucleolar protein 1-like isoform X2 n=1 Tax=Mobula hypostoma TaxID=723540 RepID=UPI002FC3D36D